MDERVFISGQIGLIPAKMELPPDKNLALETALSFQHAESVKTALTGNTGGGWEGVTQGAICWLADSRDVEAVKAAWNVHTKVRFRRPIAFLFLIWFSVQDSIYSDLVYRCQRAAQRRPD